MDDWFAEICIITYDGFIFISSKQQKGESVESFFARLIELAENFTLGDEETTLIRDAFILNMQDHDTLRELLKETVAPTSGNTHGNWGAKPTESKSKFEHNCATG